LSELNVGIGTSLIELDQASFRHRIDDSWKEAIRSLSFSIPLGCSTVILGPNGSGKSTLLKMLMRLLYPEPEAEEMGNHRSAIRILGKEQWNVWELRKQLGYVSGELDFHFQRGRAGNMTLFQAIMTGFEAVELPLEIAEISDDRSSRVEVLIDQWNLSSLRSRRMFQLSTGERRKALIARAMIHRPIGLVLDEPTAGLDMKNRQELLARLDAIPSHETTIVMVTHHIEEILPSIEMLLMIKEGELYFQGRPSEGITDDRLSRLFDTQVRVSRSESGFYAAHLA
jgi:iron complex transport system ATP-binding protein